MNIRSKITLKELASLDGINKVIDELGLLLLSKETEIKLKEEEIQELRKRIETIEQYISFYDEYYSRERSS